MARSVDQRGPGRFGRGSLKDTGVYGVEVRRCDVDDVRGVVSCQRKMGLRVSNVLLCASKEDGIEEWIEREENRCVRRKIPNLAV